MLTAVQVARRGTTRSLEVVGLKVGVSASRARPAADHRSDGEARPRPPWGPRPLCRCSIPPHTRLSRRTAD